jgi:transposase
MCPVSHRTSCPSDVNDEEWLLAVPYLTLMTEAAPQRDHVCGSCSTPSRYVIRYGNAWRAMPNAGPSPRTSAASNLVFSGQSLDQAADLPRAFARRVGVCCLLDQDRANVGQVEPCAAQPRSEKVERIKAHIETSRLRDCT